MCASLLGKGRHFAKLLSIINLLFNFLNNENKKRVFRKYLRVGLLKSTVKMLTFYIKCSNNMLK